jgi:hypothetical protein
MTAYLGRRPNSRGEFAWGFKEVIAYQEIRFFQKIGFLTL